MELLETSREPEFSAHKEERALPKSEAGDMSIFSPRRRLGAPPHLRYTSEIV
jgi:hypothetical protein